ncbi:hypothetical protein RJ639_001884 [Escallonia herrerae]|uniref:Uncharacterized protein n=1 Tax=Escallonia herrerae TaxID=1293975 RepID=A0AA88XD26_9ASTE|nr:hypothetical protein RJ639_001884 [Escallonia herrerae]
MGRGRGKGKKLTVTNHDDPGSGEEEKIPAQKRRGRPLKPLVDEFDEEEAEKIEDDDVASAKITISSKEVKSTSGTENGKKRKRTTQAKEKPDPVKVENGNGTRSSTDDSTKSNGFRHNGSRRKNKPRRAAEAGVECKYWAITFWSRSGITVPLYSHSQAPCRVNCAPPPTAHSTAINPPFLPPIPLVNQGRKRIPVVEVTRNRRMIIRKSRISRVYGNWEPKTSPFPFWKILVVS